MCAVRVVFITVPDHAAALALAEALVGERLAACVNIAPGLTSVYRWRGAVRRDAEELLIVKTTAERLPALWARLPELHPYEVPEGLALSVEDGLPAYLAWVEEEGRAEEKTP